MFKRRFPGASQSSGSYVQFVIQCQRLRSRLLLKNRTEQNPEGTTLVLEIPEFPYNTVWDRRNEASMPKPARFVQWFRYNKLEDMVTSFPCEYRFCKKKSLIPDAYLIFVTVNFSVWFAFLVFFVLFSLFFNIFPFFQHLRLSFVVFTDEEI